MLAENSRRPDIERQQLRFMVDRHVDNFGNNFISKIHEDLPGPGPRHGSLGICVFLAEADSSSLTSRPSEPIARMV